MRKLLSLSIGLLTAASALAAVKTVTIPAVPDGKGSCSFVVNEIPDSLGLTDLEYEVLNRDLKGKVIHDDSGYIIYLDGGLEQPKKNQIEIIVTDSLNTVNDTIICDINRGKSPRISISDTTICAQAELRARTLPTYELGSYWGRNIFTNEMEELPSLSNIFSVERFKIPSPDSIIWLKDYIAPNDSNVVHTNDVIFDNPSKSSLYLFTIIDTITGCQAAKIANITVKDCKSFTDLVWRNYYGPKEYHDYVMDSPSYYLRDDSIMAINPLVDCICPLSLDTIIESTQSDDTSACEHYKYDVTIKLAARLDSSYADTIVAYIIHLDNSGATFQLFKDTAIAEFAGNCVFTVPYFVLPKEEDCKCGSYYYTSNMQIGDTITESTDLIFTIKNYCTGTIFDTVHILVPEKDELVQIFGGDTTVYAKDSVSLRSIVEIRGTTLKYDWNTKDCINVPNACIILNVYKDTVTENNFVNIYSEPYILDNIKKSGKYFFTAIDTFSGCSASLDVDITVLANDTSAAPNLTADIYEQAGDIYTVSGTVVMKNVYLKDALARLKEGLYIFNNKKIYIRRRE